MNRIQKMSYAPQITNSAVHAKWAVVFAQLHINGKNEGIHGFLVRIRHEVGMPLRGPSSVRSQPPLQLRCSLRRATWHRHRLCTEA